MWTQTSGGPATIPGDGGVIEEPDSGLSAEDDAGPTVPSDAGYPSLYCTYKCGPTSRGSPLSCKPAPNGKVWCLYCGGI